MLIWVILLLSLLKMLIIVVLFMKLEAINLLKNSVPKNRGLYKITNQRNQWKKLSLKQLFWQLETKNF